MDLFRSFFIDPCVGTIDPIISAHVCPELGFGERLADQPRERLTRPILSAAELSNGF